MVEPGQGKYDRMNQNPTKWGSKPETTALTLQLYKCESLRVETIDCTDAERKGPAKRFIHRFRTTCVMSQTGCLFFRPKEETHLHK